MFARQNSLPVSKILKTEVEEVVRFLLSRFGTADRPFLPVIPIGQKEIVTLARDPPSQQDPSPPHLPTRRQSFRSASRGTAPVGIPHMPGAEEHANTYYCWGHGITAEGLVGILTIGRVL